MWVLIIVIGALSIWQIGLRAFVRGIKNGAKKTYNFYAQNRRER